MRGACPEELHSRASSSKIPREAAVCPSGASVQDESCSAPSSMRQKYHLGVPPSPPDRSEAANAEEEMRKNKIAVVALVLMSAMSVSCSRIGAPSDDAITTDIKAKMYSEPALKAATVDVISKQGEVTLTGQVRNDAARLAAYKIATETKGVSRVNDQMSVAAAEMTVPPPAAPAPEAEPHKRTAKTKVPRRAERSRQLEPDFPTTSAAAPTAAPAPPPPPQPVTVMVQANTILTVRTMDSIDSKTNPA